MDHVRERKERLKDAEDVLASVEASFREVQEREPGETVALIVWALKVARAELHHRIPEKPKRTRAARYSNKIGDCPFCGKLVDYEANYCKWCGRALDWTTQNAPN